MDNYTIIESHDPQYNKQLQDIIKSISIKRLDNENIMITRDSPKIEKTIIIKSSATELKDILADLADGYENPDPDLPNDEYNNRKLRKMFTKEEINTFPLSGGA